MDKPNQRIMVYSGFFANEYKVPASLSCEFPTEFVVR